MSAPESIAAVLQRLAKAAEGVAEHDPIGALQIATALADLADLTAAPTITQPTGELNELISELQRICLDVAPCDADTIERAIARLIDRLE